MSLSLDAAYEQINSLLLAHDIDLTIKVISQCKHAFAKDLVEKIITDESLSLSNEEKIKIIFGLAAHKSLKKNVQYELLDLLLKYPALHKDSPLLLTLARGKYADMMGLFIAWGKDRQKTIARHDLLASSAESAFSVAVAQDDYQAIEVMLSKKLRISVPYASELLWYIVNNNKSSSLVSLLVRHAHADVNYAEREKTLLIAAVEKNNIDMIRVLLDEGAVVDRVVNARKGTALTIAMRRKYTQAAELLREYGAA